MSLSVLYEFRELRVVLKTRILRAAPVCGLLCTWVPVSTPVLNAHCPNSLHSLS